MSSDAEPGDRDVAAELQRQPDLLARLAENALSVADSLRDNYFKNTAEFVKALRRTMLQAEQGQRATPLLTAFRVPIESWSAVKGEVVTFIDGGLGQVRISGRAPILLRVGSYCVRPGERQIAQREQFGYYPVILGDLEGGSKERDSFPDLVRVVAELLGGLSALQRTPDLGVLMFQGPLVPALGYLTGHSPFTERDIDRFLRQYIPDEATGRSMKAEFLSEAAHAIYPCMTRRADQWVRQRLFEPLAWTAYLLRRLIRDAGQRSPAPIVAGVVERGRMREFTETVLLERAFAVLQKNNRADYFNHLYGRTDLTTPRALLDRLGYSDSLLLAMLLQPGQFSEPWQARKYEELGPGEILLAGNRLPVDFSPLRSAELGFPRVDACYVHVSETTEPIRVEVFHTLGPEQVPAAASRTYLYARLLPGYGFPVGLDIVDKYAHVPEWLTRAYSKLIRYHLGVSLQRGEVTDAEMRRILVQAIYVTRRDWLFRPRSEGPG